MYLELFFWRLRMIPGLPTYAAVPGFPPPVRDLHMVLEKVVSKDGSLNNQQGQAEGKGGNEEINPRGEGRGAELAAMMMT